MELSWDSLAELHLTTPLVVCSLNDSYMCFTQTGLKVQANTVHCCLITSILCAYT